MKKLLCFFTLTLLTLSSCVTVNKTATTANISSDTKGAAVADLKVGERVTTTLEVSSKIRRGGLDNIKQAVEAQALKESGNADILLEPRYVVEKHRGLFGSKVKRITVSGRPATFSNFHSLHDSVWCNPVFRGVKVIYRNSGPSKGGNSTKAKALGDIYAANRIARSGWNTFINVGGGWCHDEYESDYDSNYDFEEDGFGGYGLVSIGYNLSGNWLLGLGSGVHYMSEHERVAIPFFGQIRYSLFKHKDKTPFLDYKIGAMLHTRHQAFKDKCGPYANITLGYSLGNVELGASFMVNTLEFDTGDNNTTGINLNLGFRF